MFPQIPWVERKFNFNNQAEIFPFILERFRGTPARLEEITKNLPEEVLTFKPNGKWSIKEHAGHLFDLEELGELRLTDFLNRKEILSPADITNKKTSEAGYNSRPLKDILSDFRNAREHLASRLAKLTKEEISFISIHPRLKQKMNIADWIYFMAEHDDHHLLTVRLIKDSFHK